MKPIYQSWLIQIEITNACTFKCANCTRCVGHHTKPYFMDLATVEKAVDSLKGYLDWKIKGGKVGIMGGEPTLHRNFREICEMLQRKVPANKCALWTSGHKWGEYKKTIEKTFRDCVLYNDHTGPAQKHQPVLVAIEEVVPNRKLMWELIDNCWIQQQWSASITPKGGFFCEVAAALDLAFDGPGGYPLEDGWWNKTPEQFRDQVERYCPMCSGALPMLPHSISEGKDFISPKNYERLLKLKSPKILRGEYEIYDKVLDEKTIRSCRQEWKPWQYLGENVFFNFSRKKDLKLDELWLIKGFDDIRRYYYRIKMILGYFFGIRRWIYSR